MNSAESYDKELFHHHLAYEIEMLREMHIRTGDSNDTILENAKMESFCVHARNLIEFFQSKKKGMNAKMLTDSDYIPFKHDERMIRTIKHRISSQITHLIFERTADDSKKIDGIERAKIYNIIADALARFKGKLTPQYKNNRLPDLLQISISSYGSTASASSSVTSSTQVISVDIKENTTGPTGAGH
jgi:hypothetical protein